MEFQLIKICGLSNTHFPSGQNYQLMVSKESGINYLTICSHQHNQNIILFFNLSRFSTYNISNCHLLRNDLINEIVYKFNKEKVENKKNDCIQKQNKEPCIFSNIFLPSSPSSSNFLKQLILLLKSALSAIIDMSLKYILRSL